MKLDNREPSHSNWLKSALHETSALFLMKVTILWAYQSDPLFLRSWNQVFKKSVVNSIRSSKIGSK